MNIDFTKIMTFKQFEKYFLEIYNNNYLELTGGNRKEGITFNNCKIENYGESIPDETVIPSVEQEKSRISITSKKEKIDTLNDIKINVDNIEQIPENAEIGLRVMGSSVFGERVTVYNKNSINRNKTKRSFS